MSDNPFGDLLERLKRFGRGYAELDRRLAAWQERMRPAMERFLEVASQIDDGLSAYLVLSVITLDRGGWSEVPLRDMDLTEISQLVERLWDKLDEEVERELDVAIPEYFRRDDHAALSQMIASWHVNFEDEERRRVFEDALWAHKYRRYTLSILTLASQVEGVVRDLTGDYSEGGNGESVSWTQSATIPRTHRARRARKNCQSTWHFRFTSATKAQRICGSTSL